MLQRSSFNLKKHLAHSVCQTQGQQNVWLKCYSLLFINSMFFQNAPKNKSVPNEQNGISTTQNNAYSIVNGFPSIRILMLIQLYNWCLCASSGRINLDSFRRIKCLSRPIKNRYTSSCCCCIFISPLKNVLSKWPDSNLKQIKNNVDHNGNCMLFFMLFKRFVSHVQYAAQYANSSCTQNAIQYCGKRKKCS